MFWHKRTYRINTSEQAFRDQLNKLITRKEKNTIPNHVLGEFRGEANSFRGEVNEFDFTIWQTNQRMNGQIYPIFKGEIYYLKKDLILEIKVRLNPFAEILTLFVIGAISYAFYPRGFSDFSGFLGHLFLGILLQFCFLALPLLAYHQMKEPMLKSMEEHFNLTRVRLIPKNSN